MSETPPIFGVLISGRPIHVEFARLSETDFVTEVPSASTINHMAVFLTGSVPLPDGFGASVYMRWSDNDSNSWHYLGAISNTKPSAFFRVAHFINVAANHDNVFAAQDYTGAKGSAQIGICVEAAANIEGKVAASGTSVSNQTNFEEFQEKTIKNLVNYAESFVRRIPLPDDPTRFGNFIPVETIEQWYQNFKRKLKLNPNFWRDIGSD
uniref:Hikeshi-like domain-containing protein n=1 Tax=Panagrolaimus sp. PS1159 TaxID=55785 RepID=A0AC35FJ46_9BILA